MDEPVRPLILVADDDPTIRLLAQRCLIAAGFRVLLAEDGQQALDLFAGETPELALLDVEMPRRDGFAVCRALRERFDATALALVMLTGQQDVESVNRAYSAGATDFISKPVNWPLLSHRVRYVLRSTQSLRALRDAEMRTSAIVDAIPDMIFTFDSEGRFVGFKASQAGKPFVPPQQFLGRRVDDVLPHAVADRLMTGMRESLATSTLQTVIYALPGSGGNQHFEARIVPVRSNELIAVVRDITQQRNNEHEIRQLAYFDSLTGLPNRRFIVEHIDRVITDAADTGQLAGVVFLDLDAFKRINDSMGHVFGDKLLRAAAERLRGIVRAQDLVSRVPGETVAYDVARLGGDEFTIVLSNLTATEQAFAVAERVCAALRKPFVIEGHEIGVTASVGVAIHPSDGDTADALLRSADTAMYHAKDAGRDRWEAYTYSMTAVARRRLDYEQGLRQALERDEFELHYQPQLRLHGAPMIKFEALLRWNRPGKGQLPPGEFIPIAEQSGLIVPIGDWVLREAARQAKRWSERGVRNIRVAVNVSGRQLRDADFVDAVLAALRETGCAGSAIELELTESVLMDTDAAAIDELCRLQSHDLTFAIDDFGTGYSSISYLKRFPISTLKIDRSFVNGLPQSADDIAITSAVVSLAHSLRMDVVAEGVERRVQAQCLRDLGCDALQGYFIGRPGPADAMERWLEGIASDLVAGLAQAD